MRILDKASALLRAVLGPPTPWRVARWHAQAALACALLAAACGGAALAGAGAALSALALLGLAMALGLQARAVHLRQRPLPVADVPGGSATLHGLQQLDACMLDQLWQAVGLSETATLQIIERVGDLRALSGRLMGYLGSAHAQSQQMQQEIERSGSIVAELAGFVQRLPPQIAQERQQLDTLVREVSALSSITETIRGMARQTEILAINAAIAAAHAGDAGRGFAVLAGEVRRLAMQSSEAAASIDEHIHQVVVAVQARSSGEFAQRMTENEREAARLLGLTGKLDEGYLDMRQFYAMLLTAITEHNSALDQDITRLLDTTQYQDVFKQIVERLRPAFSSRHGVVADLLDGLRRGRFDTTEADQRAQRLAADYALAEAAHDSGAPAVSAAVAANRPALERIELF